MSAAKIQTIEKQVKNLGQDDLTAFRDWFRKYDSDVWDRQIAKDAKGGKLGKYAREARAAYKAGKTTDVVAAAKGEHETVTEAIRKAIFNYRATNLLHRLSAQGQKNAKRKGLKPEDFGGPFDK